jgi:uncharacterized RDD family membrane protein YckC
VDRPAAPEGSRAGSVAGFGIRFLAFLIDGFLADLIGLAIAHGHTHTSRYSVSSYVAFLLIELVFVGFAGQTPGMRVVGIGVLRADRQGRAAFKWVALRTILLAAVIPAVVTDQTGLGMHDRAAGTATIRTR